MSTKYFIANIINLTISAGILTLPFSFYESGLILGSIILVLGAIISYITCCFIIESISIHNTMFNNDKYTQVKSPNNTELFSVNNRQTSNLSNISKVDCQAVEIGESDHHYYMNTRVELNTLSKNISSSKLLFTFISIILIFNLIIRISSSCLLFSNVLEGTITYFLPFLKSNEDFSLLYYSLTLIY